MGVSTETNQQSASGKRYDYLDNLKWTLAIVVILHHAAAIAGLDPFPINLPQVDASQQFQYKILSTFQSVNQGYFMSLFFFISAYFIAPSYNRKGAKRFLTDKLKRLGIPTLLTVVLIDPLAMYICDDHPLLESLRSTLAMYMTMLQKGNMLLGVTWFCWSLIVFSAFYAAARKMRPQQGTRDNSGEQPIPSTMMIIIFATAMIPFNYLGNYLMELLGNDFLGFHLLKYFPMYIVMFYFGLQAKKNKWLAQLTYRHAFTWMIIWLVARVFINPFSVLASRPFEVIGMSIFMLYSYKTLFNQKNKYSQSLSRGAYAAYVLQVVPLCILAKAYLPHMTQWPVVNFFVIGIPAVTLTFTLAYFLCNMPLLRKIF